MLFSNNKAYTDAIVALAKALIELGEDEIEFLFGGPDSDNDDEPDSGSPGYMLTDIFDAIGELDPKLCKKPPKPAWSPQSAY